MGTDYNNVDDNRCLWIYKIIRFSHWVVAVVEGEFSMFAGRAVAKIENCEQGGSGGPNFGQFVRT